MPPPTSSASLALSNSRTCRPASPRHKGAPRPVGPARALVSARYLLSLVHSAGHVFGKDERQDRSLRRAPCARGGTADTTVSEAVAERHGSSSLPERTNSLRVADSGDARHGHRSLLCQIAPFAKRLRHLAYTQTFGGSSPSGGTKRPEHQASLAQWKSAAMTRRRPEVRSLEDAPHHDPSERRSDGRAR